MMKKCRQCKQDKALPFFTKGKGTCEDRKAFLKHAT